MGVFKDMKELELKDGCNPNQRPARIFMREGELPITVLNGKPGYIYFLDALNAWQLVKELRQATGLPAAASFKHVSPAGAALGLPFRPDVSRPNRDNAIDVYISDEWEDVLGDGVWAETFTTRPEPLTPAEKKEWLSKVTGVCLGSDAFFPFGDNIERARRSGVTAIVEPGGSIRDGQVIETCDKYGIVMAFNGIRLFHH